MEFLNKFILQAQIGKLSTKNYNNFWEEYSYTVKVSFGMGEPAKIPWISFLAPGMFTSKGFYPVYLYYKDQGILILSFGISETNSYQGDFESQDFPINWSTKITEEYSKISNVIEKPRRYGNSFIFKKYLIDIDGKNISYLDENNNNLSPNELNKDLNKILEIYATELKTAFEAPSYLNKKVSFFSIESQLENFIVDNWENTVLSEKYELLVEDGEVVSRKYKADGVEGKNEIDILVKNKKNKNFVVIELKRNQTNDETIGQTLRYMGWIKKYKNDKNVKGIIIAHKYDKKLNLALSMTPEIEAMTYEIDFKLKNYD